jgi:hypothetical protein
MSVPATTPDLVKKGLGVAGQPDDLVKGTREAIVKGDAETAKKMIYMIQEKGNLMCSDLLQFTLSHGQEDVADVLLKCPSGPFSWILTRLAVDVVKELYDAITHGDTKAAKEMIQKINAKDSLRNSDLLQLALSYGQEDVADLLLETVQPCSPVFTSLRPEDSRKFAKISFEMMLKLLDLGGGRCWHLYMQVLSRTEEPLERRKEMVETLHDKYGVPLIGRDNTNISFLEGWGGGVIKVVVDDSWYISAMNLPDEETMLWAWEWGVKHDHSKGELTLLQERSRDDHFPKFDSRTISESLKRHGTRHLSWFREHRFCFPLYDFSWVAYSNYPGCPLTTSEKRKALMMILDDPNWRDYPGKEWLAAIGFRSSCRDDVKYVPPMQHPPRYLVEDRGGRPQCGHLARLLDYSISCADLELTKWIYDTGRCRSLHATWQTLKVFTGNFRKAQPDNNCPDEHYESAAASLSEASWMPLMEWVYGTLERSIVEEIDRPDYMPEFLRQEKYQDHPVGKLNWKWIEGWIAARKEK